jgi:hypothetical protein
MKKQLRRVVALIGMTCALTVVNAELLSSQRAPGGPPTASPFDAFYTLGPDSLPREGVRTV